MGATRYPADLRREAIDAVVVPLPIPEMTPPEIKMYFVDCLLFVSGTIHCIKLISPRQPRATVEGSTSLSLVNLKNRNRFSFLLIHSSKSIRKFFSCLLPASSPRLRFC